MPDDALAPPNTQQNALVEISLDPATGQPVVDSATVSGYWGSLVLWRSTLGVDTAWVVRLVGDESPFRGGDTEFRSGNNPKAPRGDVIRRNIPDGTVYRYVVKLIVNEGRDTLGLDPEIHVKDPR